MAWSNTCRIDGCEKTTTNYAHTCDMHQSRLKRRGDADFERYRRPVTDTEAWCNKGQHMVPHAGFAKGQRMCRECRKVYAINNYSLGKTCADCSKPIVDKSEHGRCLSCHGVAIRGKNVTRKRRPNYQGYIIIAGEWEHPNANKRGQVLEHVKVMSDMLGRPLRPGENVHHKNGVRDDNRPENLELWVSSQPSGQRPEDLVAWAYEILGRYADEVAA